MTFSIFPNPPPLQNRNQLPERLPSSSSLLLRIANLFGYSAQQVTPSSLTNHDITQMPLEWSTSVFLATFRQLNRQEQMQALGLDNWSTEGNKEEACNRIIACVLETSEILDLSNLKLTSLPNTLGNLSKLKSLRVNFNKLASFPETIGKLTQLRWLSISYNEFSDLPNSIFRLPSSLTIRLVGSKLSNAVLVRLQEQTQQPGYNGPCFDSLADLIKQGQFSALPLNTEGLLDDSAPQGTSSSLANHAYTLKSVDWSSPTFLATFCRLNRQEQMQALGLDNWSTEGNKEEACNRIIACVRDRSKFLGLLGLGLTTLPNTIGNLSQLESLNVYFNKLTFLPNTIGNLSKLRVLLANNNELTSLPEAVGDLSQLQMLHVSFNKLTFLPNTIGNLSQLRVLLVNNNELTTLPKTVGNLSRLQALLVNNNGLTSLPETIGNLSQLQWFNVACNELTSLSEALGKLTLLKWLNVHSNKLTSLPKAIGDLSQLESLNAAYNKLVCLPETLGNLTQLQRLYVHNNKFSDLPSSIFRLPSRLTIDLLGSRFSNEVLVRLQDQTQQPGYNGPRIDNLADLMNWSSSTFLANFRQLDRQKQMQTLGLDNWSTEGDKEEACNRIITCVLKARKILDLFDLRLTTLPETIGSLTQLETLEISFNKLSSLPKAIGNLSKLQTLHVVGNQLTSLPETIGSLTQLETLDVSLNKLSSLPKAIGNLSKLQALIVSKNKLPSLPNTIGNLPQLQYLIVSFNRLTTLPETIGNLSKLQKLYVSSNKLVSLPETIDNLSKLQMLVVKNNELRGLPKSILQLSSRLTIDLSGSRLSNEVLVRLQALIQQPDYNGPRFIIL